MKRRSLLTMIPAASALLAMRSHGTPITVPALSAAGFGIAVQCWSFNRFSLFEAVEMAAAAGAAGVELYPGQRIGGPHGDTKFGPDVDETTLQSVIEHLRKNQITPMNFGVTGVSRNEDDARKLFEFAKKLDLYGITTEQLNAVDLLEKLAAEYDIKVCFHNHPKPTALWNPDTISAAIDGRHANLGFCADIGHWASSALDPLEAIRKIAPRVHAFHMKDRASIEEWSHDRPFGTGIIKLPEILDEVRKHGFAGNVSIEYEHNWENNVAEVAQCAGYLRAYSNIRA
jgi:sugar phosphate isomerase/epimerase